MTTPTENTPYDIIGDAMEDAGLLQEGDSPNPEQLAKYMRRLRDLIRLWQTQGLKLWTNVDTPVSLTAGQNLYTFFPGGSVDMVRPLRVLEGYYLYTANNVKRPVTVLAWRDWLTLSQAGTLSANRGPISQYFVNKLSTQLQVYTWLCPDSVEAANGVLHVLLQTQITSPVNLVETMQFPEEWRIALRWGLADDICTGQPSEIMNRCATRASAFRSVLEDWDVEDAPVNFAVDQRSFTPYNNFS